MNVTRSSSFIELLDGAGFALLGESLFSVAKKVTKNACPYIRPCAARRVRSLHRCSRGRLTRAVLGPLSLSPHPCGSLPYATVPLTLLKGAVGVACGFVQKGHATDTSRSFKRLGLRSPSGGRVEVLRRGTRGMDAERGAKGQGRPFVTAPGAAPEGGNPGVAGAGCRARFLFGYFLFRASKEKVTRPGGRNQRCQHTR